MGLKGAFAMYEVHLLGMRQYFDDVGKHRPTLRFNMTRPRNSLTFVGNRELRHTDIEPVCGPKAGLKPKLTFLARSLVDRT